MGTNNRESEQGHPQSSEGLQKSVTEYIFNEQLLNSIVNFKRSITKVFLILFRTN